MAMAVRKRKPLAATNVNETDSEPIASSKATKAGTAKAQRIVTELDASGNAPQQCYLTLDAFRRPVHAGG